MVFLSYRFSICSIQDEKQVSVENQRLRTEIDALEKFKVKLETVLQNHVAKCNMKDNASFGRFINLLHDTNSVDIPSIGSDVVLASTNSLTDTIHPHAKTGYVPSSFTEETNLKNIGDEQLVNRGQSLGQRKLDRTYLRNMSKEQKISMLKAYLKGNQSKREAQKLIGQRAEHTVQQVRFFYVVSKIVSLYLADIMLNFQHIGLFTICN